MALTSGCLMPRIFAALAWVSLCFFKCARIAQDRSALTFKTAAVPSSKPMSLNTLPDDVVILLVFFMSLLSFVVMFTAFGLVTILVSPSTSFLPVVYLYSLSFLFS